MKTAAAVALVVSMASLAQAQVTQIEILSREPAPPAADSAAYEILRGKIHGELDPADRRNAIIQDITLAPKNVRGRVEYVATFTMAKPIDMGQASGVLLYTVVNRGNGNALPNADGHVTLVSGWQGDVTPTPANQTITVPIARNPDGSSITGPMIARFVNVPAGTNTVTVHLGSIGSGPPQYPPASLDDRTAHLISAASEDVAGRKTGVITIPRDAWAFADCRTTPFPGTPDPTQLCLKDGFDPSRLYELTYTVKDPLVLGIGLAATRDILAFFHHAKADALGTANPVADALHHVVAVGYSQSGNMLRSFVHLGFNEDLEGRLVMDGVFPLIAARQTPINLRFGLPGGAAGPSEAGSEPALWWSTYEDTVRGRKPASLLDRCTASHTCPKVFEAFGSTEFWGLRMSPDLVGTDAKADIPLPANVRRYYYPGTTHGGGPGGFRIDPASPTTGACALPANPNPESDTTRALTVALIQWVVNGTPPPDSRYPLLSRHELAPATRRDIGFPQIPGLPFTDALVNPLLDYDFGRTFIAADLTGAIERYPPTIVHVLPTLVPVVDGDGNERTNGVPSVLYQAPLGTYLGWNITAGGFFKGQICGFVGSYWPFAKTRAEREAAKDPRLSVEERYGTLDGYLCVVRRAAEIAVRDRFLLRADADRLIKEATASNVLPTSAHGSPEAKAIADRVCSARGSQ